MSRLLYIQASPRIRRSYSIAVADTFIQAYKQNNPNDEIITLNVFEVLVYIVLPVEFSRSLAGKNLYPGAPGQSNSREFYTLKGII